MIDKETRNEIICLLARRRKKLGKTLVTPLDLVIDLQWISENIGMIMDEIHGENRFEG